MMTMNKEWVISIILLLPSREEQVRREEAIVASAGAVKELSLLLEKRATVQLDLGRLERHISNHETRCQTLETQADTIRHQVADLRTVIRNHDKQLQLAHKVITY